MIEPALKRSSTAFKVDERTSQPVPGKEYDKVLHRRFLSWKSQQDFSKDEDVFCDTTPSRGTWEVLQYCFERRVMGSVALASGSGKTITAAKFAEKYQTTVLITADIAFKHLGNILRLIANKVHCPCYYSLSTLLDGLVERFKGSQMLIVIDDAHFLTWEGFEAVRKIYDLAGVGICYLGQETLLDRMKGPAGKCLQYDQILSRLSIRRSNLKVTREDVRQICDSLCPGMDKASVDFLFSKAQGQGRFRTMTNILKLAVRNHIEQGSPMGVHLVRDAAAFLGI